MDKFYNVTFLLAKHHRDIQAQNVFQEALSESEAINMSLPVIADMLIDGYTIEAKKAQELPSSIAPQNSECACYVSLGENDTPKWLYIDLQADCDDSFKQDLQALMSKYFKTIEPIFPNHLFFATPSP